MAATADTKTKNDGLNTVWTTGDALNVFHAEAGSTTYGTNDQFTYTGADNKFKGKLKKGQKLCIKVHDGDNGYMYKLKVKKC